MYVQTCFVSYETQLSIFWCFWYSGMLTIRVCIPSSILSGLFSFQLGPRESSLPRYLRRDSFSTLFMKGCGRGGYRRAQCSSITATASATHHSGRTAATPAATAAAAAATAEPSISAGNSGPPVPSAPTQRPTHDRSREGLDTPQPDQFDLPHRGSDVNKSCSCYQWLFRTCMAR